MKCSRRTFAAAAGALGFSAASRQVESSENWPGWRGPGRTGGVDSQSWPSSFSGLQKVWSLELGKSYSGPIVFDNRVYTTETIDRRDESLIALNATTGEQIWKRQWPGAMTVPFFAKANGDWIRSTPTSDGERIVVAGMRDVVKCFACENGDLLWQRDFNSESNGALPSFGLVCSPLIEGDAVYIQAGGGVQKLSLETGATVWKAFDDPGGMNGGAFSSPMIATIAAVKQLVVQTRTTIGGIDLASGQVLWSREIASFRGMNILTPTVWNDHVFTSSYGGRSSMLKIEKQGSNWSNSLAWQGKAEAYMSSPVVVNNHLFMHLRNQRVCCINLSDGVEKWRTTPFGKYWSMVTNDRKILALDEKGELILIAANKEEFELIDRKPISSSPSWAHIALVGSTIFVRRLDGLDAYRWA